MNKKVASNIKLGMFITLGIVLFVGGIYIIGSRKNLFSSTTQVVTTFDNVGGLQAGNAVRFSGITVGNVERIEIINSRKVKVVLSIDKKTSQFIKKDALAVIGSEGLMGDKVINISSGSPDAPSIKDGDILESNEPIDMEELMVTFRNAGQKAGLLLENLATISEKVVAGEGSLGKIVSDDEMYQEVKMMLKSFNNSSRNAELITKDFLYLSSKARRGEGNLGKLIVDESIYNGLDRMMDTLRVASRNAVQVTNEMANFSEQLNNKDGAVGKLLYDTAFATNIDHTLGKISGAASGIENTTDRLTRSWLFNFLMGKKKEGKYK